MTRVSRPAIPHPPKARCSKKRRSGRGVGERSVRVKKRPSRKCWKSAPGFRWGHGHLLRRNRPRLEGREGGSPPFTCQKRDPSEVGGTDLGGRRKGTWCWAWGWNSRRQKGRLVAAVPPFSTQESISRGRARGGDTDNCPSPGPPSAKPAKGDLLVVRLSGELTRSKKPNLLSKTGERKRA